MRSEIDNLMAARQLDALMVITEERYDAVVDYLTNGARITGGVVLKRRGEAPVLAVGGMETEEAKASGLEVRDYSAFGYHEVMKAHKDDPVARKVAWWQALLAGVGVEGGRVGIYGAGDLNVYLEVFRAFDREVTAYTLVGEAENTLFQAAMETKDADEMARIRGVAARTNEVIRATWDYIAGHRADGEAVVDVDGQPLTIGAVKRFVRRELIERGLEDTGMIFAQGRDAGYPHSRGEDEQPLRQGQSIVFDLFPRELGGGYHHDMTRTWCIGHAPEAVQTAYEQVMEAFDRAVEATKPGMQGGDVQQIVLDYFEGLGHPTSRSEPGTQAGYVHSLGHGVGLHIHEPPRMSHVRSDELRKGSVVTIEPGLYYPERGFGIRVEDMVAIREDGSIETLTDFPKDLVLPLRG